MFFAGAAGTGIVAADLGSRARERRNRRCMMVVRVLMPVIVMVVLMAAPAGIIDYLRLRR